MKRKFHIVLEDSDHRQLKSMAGLSGLTMGETIHALLSFTEAHQYIQDETFQGRFADLLESELQSAGANAGGWSGVDDFDFKAKAAEIRRREAEDESD